jgi:hypothetical protein
MKNPIDLIGSHPSGGLTKTIDERDYHPAMPEIGLAQAPLNWSTGYDIETDISNEIGVHFALPTKNQGVSGSCGGQAMSYYGQVLSAYYPHVLTERSAKFLYSQAFNPYGGGSDDRTLAKLAISQGFAPEGSCVSYQNGQAPSEAFMERVGDLTPTARLQASGDKMQLAYTFPSADLESVAGLIPYSKGAILLLHGSNNGTWLSDVPKPPTSRDTLWAHYMYAGKPQIYAGQKGIWAKQSWGTGAGLNGWQFLNEDYFASGHILDAMGLLYNSKPDAPPQHQFGADLKLGDTGAEITALQTLLAYDGEFNLNPTGLYGPITARAVLQFQLKYSLASVATLDELGGHIVGPATRAKLNAFV